MVNKRQQKGQPRCNQNLDVVERKERKQTDINPCQTAISDIESSGEGGIRTLGDVAATPVFETGPIGHSGTSPGCDTLAEVYGNYLTLARPATGRLAFAYVSTRTYFRRSLPCFWNNSSQACINASFN